MSRIKHVCVGLYVDNHNRVPHCKDERVSSIVLMYSLVYDMHSSIVCELPLSPILETFSFGASK